MALALHPVRRAGVLGAGVMGAQIAAHLANAGIGVLLFDLAAADGPANGIVARALDGLAKLEPAPLASAERAALIAAANYDHDLPRLGECDLVIEAIAERMDWKRDLYARIVPHLSPEAALVTNTSGLSIGSLAGALPAAVRPRFCGVHFFNPPRYMHLVELIQHDATDPGLMDRLETFLTTTLGKGVVRARDTPNFIANRVGIFSVLATMHHAHRLGLGFDVVDALTGPAIGRAKSATYRTSDVVGLDTMALVIRTMHDTLPDDPWHALFDAPPALAALVAQGSLGQKTKAGFYRKVGKTIEVLDPAIPGYRPADGAIDPEVAKILADDDPGRRLAALRACAHPQAEFLWSIYRDLFHYCAVHLAAIADNARDVDLALRWGFGWQTGPFELWQAAGWQAVATWIDEDLRAGRTLAPVALPQWIRTGPAALGVHRGGQAWSADAARFQPRSALPVYGRQYFPDPIAGERSSRGTTVFENDAVRMWHLAGDVAIVSWHGKGHTISERVLDGVLESIDRAETGFGALLLWQAREPFSLGADLKSVAPDVAAGRFAVVEAMVAKFQATAQRLRYSLVPTVAAVRGMALGGACEFILHCDRTVAALESYIGLVEVGVGLLPAGGGCKEFALRAYEESKRGNVGSQLDQLPYIRTYFQSIAKATVARSALDAKVLGYLQPADVVVFNPHELLFVAHAQARALAASAYRPPPPRTAITVAGKTGIATLEMLLVNMRDGGFISAYDFEVSLRVARVLCGGEVESGSVVDERWLLDLERREFLELVRDVRTQERIAHTLATGKPLRN
ncbi:MAG: 3-hydroxyacyl-CoA dehydrogenase/enoyl-CoA hydratase family protein [Casimicrobiaceae bacterium]